MGWSVEEGLKKGREPPDWYYEKPPITQEMIVFAQAFEDLDTMRPRQLSMAGQLVGKIPWDAVDRYAERLGLDDQNTGLFHRMIRAMDAVFLKFERERIKKAAPRNTPVIPKH